MAREYEFEREITNPGAITLLQITAGAAMPITLMKATVSQRNSITSTAFGAYVVRKSAAATVTAAVAADIRKLDPGDSASVVQLGTALTGYAATVEGTDGDILWREGDNILNGYYQEPQPELRITVPGGGIVGLKLSQSLTGIFSCKFVFAEGMSG